MCAAENNPVTAMALLKVGPMRYALPARLVHSILEEAPPGICVDLLARLAVDTPPLPQRWTLRLQDYQTPLRVGQSVQVAPVPVNQFETLPRFLQGLADRACLQGWLTHRGVLTFLLDVDRVMRGHP